MAIYEPIDPPWNDDYVEEDEDEDEEDDYDLEAEERAERIAYYSVKADADRYGNWLAQ